MKLKNASVSLLCLITITIFSCTKDGGQPATVTDVYAAGYNNGKVVYWKNGVETALASSSYSDGTAYAIAVSGPDVYVAGKSKSNAVYWKNGVEIPLYNAPDGFSRAMAIAVNGGDVYITGIEVFNSTGQNAFIWKNGVKTILSPLSYSCCNRVGTGIALVGSDVYVCGTLSGTPVYWKNGVEHILPSQGGGTTAETTGIAVSGTDVYVSGRDGSRAVYWKNGVKTDLTPLTTGTANGVFVSGSDVYVAGRKDNQATVWKNNIETMLDPSYASAPSAIAGDGKDIYISGNIPTNSTTTCLYWQNGVKKELAFVTNYPSQMAIVNAITVVSR